jgi:uncharacterized protein YndB with AHSA1/START domain
MNLSSTIERPFGPTLRAASVRVSRQLRASAELIFDAWLAVDEARACLVAGRVGQIRSASIDARVGGGFSIVRRRAGEDVEYSGEFLEIDRPHRLVFSLFVERYAQWDDRVIVELAPVAGHSLLVLTHELSLPNPAQRSHVRRGWARVLDGLAARCAEGRLRGAVAQDQWAAAGPPQPLPALTSSSSGIVSRAGSCR